uniref:Uncharacterized protein n=1 Tax=Myotis myotis TaxID=51298 RepID=A0A7J7ZXP9_MYOMY|nr:hypothetical protein mMyoMyo1_009790 [Myotis myotis]
MSLRAPNSPHLAVLSWVSVGTHRRGCVRGHGQCLLQFVCVSPYMLGNILNLTSLYVSLDYFLVLKRWLSPGWFGSVDRALACGLKGPRFDSGQGHVPGLRALSPLGGMQEAADDLSLPLLSSLKSIKKKYIFKKRWLNLLMTGNP